MANNAIEGLAKIGLLIENKKATEEQMLSALASMIMLRDNGLYKNWGFNAFAENYEKFIGEEFQSEILIECVKCQNQKRIQSTTRNNYKHCSCGGAFWVVNEDE